MPILDSSGKPVNIKTRSVNADYDSRAETLQPQGKTMLSKLSNMSAKEVRSSYTKLSADIESANPSIRSPLLNQSNFYMPESDSSTGEPNRLLNQWIAYYVKWHPMLGNLLSLHAELPLSRFALRGIEDPKILTFYEDMVESAELHLKMVELLKNYFTFGEVFPYAFWSDTYNCFTDLTFLDSNFVFVKGHYLLHSDEGDDVQFFELEPDPMLRNIVESDDYVTSLLRDKLDPEFVSAVRQNKRLMLSNFSTSMISNKIKYSDIRGTSIVLRCLKRLLYQDKLYEAQYSIADAHINPKWIWKLGQAGDLATGGYMPTEEDLDAFRELLIQANNDPIFTIITHYAVNVDAVGLAGKILPIQPELQQIKDDILTALFSNEAVTTGQGPNFACYDEETETLTEDGFKKIGDIKKGEKIATFNPVTEELEYHVPMSKHVYDYDSARDGKMVHFKTGKMDICVTPNHRMYTKRRYGDTWEIRRADEINPRSHFRSTVKWQGEYKSVPKDVQKFFGKDITLADWCELVGYFVSEGWVVDKYRDHRVGIRQLSTSKHYEAIKSICFKFGFSAPKDCFLKCGVEVSKYFKNTFGNGCLEKHVPKWMKNLPTPYLNILLTALVNGDGNRRPATKKKGTFKKYYSYCSTSKQLADDVYEIAYKIGFVPNMSQDKKVPKNHNRRYYVMWSDADTSKYPCVHTKTKGGAIHRIDYNGKVYCFEVPNHLFITRRNGLVTVQGNTASVAFRAMMSRYIPIRAKVDRFLYHKIFAPVAYANKFYKRRQCDLDGSVRTGDGETNQLIIPQIDWRSKTNLMDDGSVKSIIASAVNSGRLPVKTLADALDLDYREIKNYLWNEQGSVFDSIAIEGRKRVANQYTDPTLMGQPFLPKSTNPVNPPNLQPQAKAASLNIKPLHSEKTADTEDTKPDKDLSDIQNQVDKSQKGNNPQTPDPYNEAIKASIFDGNRHRKKINTKVLDKRKRDHDTKEKHSVTVKKDTNKVVDDKDEVNRDTDGNLIYHGYVIECIRDGHSEKWRSKIKNLTFEAPTREGLLNKIRDYEDQVCPIT